ncbi:hypothetical protein GBAR_LOCUS16252 [Geodia barretti]|uniref:Death domain-containing protein n=1 Tax=Geodia barretti TaxID=519541 RepID=A0AA35SFI9_GEOBA|nr:hypothetical protein GBAR_LOCUS16252 [Geodia barretti]
MSSVGGRDSRNEELLRAPFTTENANRIAQKITSWRLLAPFLGLDKGDEAEISEEGSLGEQRIKMMQVWLSRHGKDATYLNFVRGCEEAGRRDLVDTVYSLVQQHSSIPLTVSLDCGSLARLGRAPTLLELCLFTGRSGTRYRVMERLAPFWEQLALALNFEPYVTETVKRSSMFQVSFKWAVWCQCFVANV